MKQILIKPGTPEEKLVNMIANRIGIPARAIRSFMKSIKRNEAKARLFGWACQGFLTYKQFSNLLLNRDTTHFIDWCTEDGFLFTFCEEPIVTSKEKEE